MRDLVQRQFPLMGTEIPPYELGAYPDEGLVTARC